MAEVANGEGDLVHLVGEQPLSVTVPLRSLILKLALMELITIGSGHPGDQHVLEPPAYDLRVQGAAAVLSMSCASSEALLRERIMVCVWFGGIAPYRAADRPTQCLI